MEWRKIMILLQQMLILFLIMFIGYMMAKKGILDQKANKAISWLIVNVTSPALILEGSFSNSGMDPSYVLYISGISFCFYAVIVLSAELVVPLFHFPAEDRGAFKVMMVFSNNGFMGIPLLRSLYGPEILLPAAIFVIPCNLLMYTYAIYRISGRQQSPGQVLKGCMNMGVLASFLSVTITLSGISLPSIITDCIGMLSPITAPLSMIVIGSGFVGLNMLDEIRDRKLILFVFVRQIVMPVLLLTILRIFIKDIGLLRMILIICATPVASMPAMLAQQYGGRVGLISHTIAFTTLISIATIPLVYAITGL